MSRKDFPCWRKPLTPAMQAAVDAKETELFREYYAASKAFERASQTSGMDLAPFERRCDDADQTIIRFQVENTLRTTYG